MIDIQELRRMGVRLTQTDGRLTVDAPNEVWTDRLREEIRANKVEIANALEADELTFHLELTLIYTHQQSQRCKALSAQHRRVRKLWRDRECRLRERGFTGCIRGLNQRCMDRQVLWCSHCRTVAQRAATP